MSEHNGAAPESRAQRLARLGRQMEAQIAELEALSAWAAGQEQRHARLEILAAACDEDRQDRQGGIVWLSE